MCRKSLGQRADDYGMNQLLIFVMCIQMYYTIDSDLSSGAHSSASSGHESDYTDGKNRSM